MLRTVRQLGTHLDSSADQTWFTAQAAAGGQPAGTGFPSSLLALETVGITVPTEPFNPSNAGLERLRRLIVVPVHNADVRFSLFLLRCTEHSSGTAGIGYHVEGLSRTAMLKALRTPAKMNPLKRCQACAERSAAASTRETWSASQLPFRLYTPGATSESRPAASESVGDPERVTFGPHVGESIPRRPYGFDYLPQPAWAPTWSNVPNVTLVDVMGTVVPDTIREGPNTPTQVSVRRFIYAVRV